MERHLTAYLLVRISAEYEFRIESLFEALAARIKEKWIRNLVVKFVSDKLRSPKIETICGVLNAFNDGWGKAFAKGAGIQATIAYDSIILNRHGFVHEAKCTVTMGDLESFFQNSVGIFSSLVATMGLCAKEIKHLH